MKMSRSYEADWERKKSYLIRSLFHDIPYRALSPVLEESTQSSDALVHERSTQSSDRLKSTTSSEVQSLSESAADNPSETLHCDDLAPATRVTTLTSRPYSPLPPLIIERMPNRHDEPVEYYRKLLNKIRIIYRKMFLEGKSLTDDDYVGSEFETNEITEVIALAKGSSDFSETSSCYSNGYSADLETSDDEGSNNGVEIEVENNLSDNRQPFVHESEQRANFSDENATNLNISPILNIEEIVKTSSVSNEDPDYRQITIQVDVHMDGTPLAEPHPSPVYGEQQVEVTPIPASEGLPVDMLQSIVPEEVPGHTILKPQSVPQLFPLEIPQLTEYEAVLSPRCAGPVTASQARVYEKSSLEFTRDLVYNAESEVIQYRLDADVALEVTQSSVCQESVRSPILSFNRRYEKPSEEIITKGSKHRDTNREKFLALTGHSADSSSQGSVSEVTPNPVFVLRFRRTGERSHVEERQLTVAEGDHDPETTASSAETENPTSNIEVMRTPRPETSQESIPVDTRLTSDMDFTCEHNTIPRDVSIVTSQSQDDCQNCSTAEPKTSCGIDDILTSIFNESSDKPGSLSSIEKISEGTNSRKRVYEEISVQTENVTWNELRANFFVGTPKIFRLCSCVDHFCKRH